MSRELKNSGIPWIGDIPKGWSAKKLKFSCKLFGRIGFRGYTADDLVDESEGAITLSPTNMSGIKLDYSKCSYLSWDKYYESPEIMVNVGDVLLVKTASVGKCSYVDYLPKETTVNPQILVLKEHKDCSKFIAYFFQTSVGEAYIDTTKGGSTIYTISQEKIGNYEFVFPSLEEQHKIASFLDRKCAEIDEMIALQEKIVEELKAYKQSVITEAVTKGLNPDAPMKDSGIEWVDSIPLSWKVAKIKNVISLLTDYDANGSFADIASNVKVNLGIPYAWMVRATDLANQRYGLVDGNNYCDISTFNYLKKSVVHSGDILIAKRGEIGKVYLVPNVDCPMTLAPNTYLLKLRQRVIDNRYFHYFLTSEMGRMQLVLNNKSTAIGAIYKDDVKSISILLPSLREQQDIANHLDTKCTEIDNLISIKLSKIDSLKEYKKSIIYEYVTGKKEVIE